MRRASQDGACRAGFTLLEILAAMVMVGIVLPVAMGGISLAMNAGSNARRRAEAVALAESKLAEIRLEPLLTDGQSSGDCGQEHPEFRWSAYILTRELGLKEVTVMVSWGEGYRERSMALTTFVYQVSQ
jgi:prepilin-type N-terminal cleavage/methylation domain-containing protein